MVSVAVIIVTFNSEREIRACLESISAQNLEDYRVVVVDNASSDDTVGEIRLSKADLTLIENSTNRGFAAACNQAASAADSEFILLLNPDARLCDGAVSELVSAIRSEDGAGIAGPRLLSEDGRLLPSAYRFPTIFQEIAYLFRLKPILTSGPFKAIFGKFLSRWFGQFDPHDTRRVVDSVLGACMLIRGELWRELNGFNERFFLFYEEKDFCKRALDAGYRTIFVPDAQAIHEIGASCRSNPTETDIMKRESMMRYYRKHKSLCTNVVLWIAVLLSSLFATRCRMFSRCRNG
ncbi:MAG: glycosyltransferase family 2 protein [Candidatus Coatesbacteria bacterium]|nr:glycosyltransferase family 2 protein [Candidatus Coatesbacteria bacterium]